MEPERSQPSIDDASRLEIRPPFIHYRGFCWVADIDSSIFPETDDVSDPSRSCLALAEDNQELGPAHYAHDEIALKGKGTYSHWAGRLFFSSSDNTDPNENGRSYAVREDRDLYFRRHAVYALNVIKAWARYLDNGFQGFAGKSILEIGPGRDLSTVISLVCLHCREIWAVDRFVSHWQDGWHEEFLDALSRELMSLGLPVDLDVIKRATMARTISIPPISFCRQPLEQLGTELIGRFDLSLSHSTFEHLYEFGEAARALYRAMAPGGRGVHHVDFRDHFNVGSPLNFLLLDDEIFADPQINANFGRGNRIRPGEMHSMLLQAGFSEVSFAPTSVIDPEYLRGLMPRLRESQNSRYSSIDKSELEVLSGVFLIER